MNGEHRRMFTRRQFMIYDRVIAGDTSLVAATEAASSWAIDNPEVDMDEQMTWREWEAQS